MSVQGIRIPYGRTLVRLWLVVLFACCHAAGLRAQEADRFDLVVRGAPLARALEELSMRTGTRLVFSSALTRGHQAYCVARDRPAEELLRCVLEESGLDFVRSSSGTYIIIEGVRQEPEHGRLAGRVVDAESGEPLPYANVMLAEAQTGTSTNRAGYFAFAGLVSGLQRVVVSYVGYRSIEDSVWISPGDRRVVQLALEPHRVEAPPVVIDGLVQRLPSDVLGGAEMSGSRLRRTSPLGTPDWSLAAGRVAGVAVQQPLADIHIQGGDNGEHLTTLDGVPVRDPVSLGRHLAAFSSLALERLTVEKAGFGAQHGSHLSGIVSAHHDLSTSSPANLVVSVDPVSVNGRFKGAVRPGSTRSVEGMVAARSSLWGVYADAGVEQLLRDWNTMDPVFASIWLREPVRRASLTQDLQVPDVRFFDVHAAARAKPSPFQTLEVSGYKGLNRIAVEHAAVNTVDPTTSVQGMLTRDAYEWKNWAGQVRHTALLGARTVTNLQARAADHRSSYVYRAHRESGPPSNFYDLDAFVERSDPNLSEAVGSDEEHRIRELAGEAAATHSLAPGRDVSAGLTLRHVSSVFDLRNLFLAPWRHEVKVTDLSGYLAARLSLGWAWVIEPSLRLSYIGTLSAVFEEPRLSLRYDRMVRSSGHFAARLSAGVYRQFVSQLDLTSSGVTEAVPSIRFWLPLDGTMRPPRATHLAFEGSFATSDHWRVLVETFFKRHHRLLVLDYAGLARDRPAVRPAPPAEEIDQDAFLEATDGHARGLAVELEFRPDFGSARVSYALTRSRRRYPGRFDDRLVPTPWNEPHRVVAETDIDFGSAVRVSASWIAGWGRTWVLRRSYYDFIVLSNRDVDFGGLDLNSPDASTVGARHQVDLGIRFTPVVGRTPVEFGFNVSNLLNRRAVYDRSLETGLDGNTDLVPRLLPGRLVLFSLRVGR